MDGIARAAPEERAELFRRSAGALRPERSPAVVEKDFWVCWALRRLYEVLRFRPQMIFKGGTSLSKAYDAIARFSEDVDLSLSRRDLGFADSRDPEEPGISGKESKRRIEALVAECARVIRSRLLPELRGDFGSLLGGQGWKIDLDSRDPQTLVFSYPRSEPAESLPSVMQPVIRLELGARSDDWPAEHRDIRPFAADAFPGAFAVAESCRVLVMDARRTFWEKVTLLHAESHRPTDKAIPEGLSRHYYDVQQLLRRDIGPQALDRRDLLIRVVAHKERFFSSAWANYGAAATGGLRLVPPESRMPSLRADYSRMREMIFGEVPSWAEIVRALERIEKRINRESATTG